LQHLKTFRENLFFRINVIQIHIPPLQLRTEDIPLLASFFIRRYNTELGYTVQRFTKEAMGG